MPLYRILLEEGIASDTVYFDIAHQFFIFNPSQTEQVHYV